MENHFIWTDGIEFALIDLKNKALSKSEYHKKNYYFFKGYLKYFRIPTIIFSGVNSVFNVGLQPYLSQGIISILCCSISLICGIIASVELFLGLQNMMEKELISSKEFYILSYDIFKILSIEREHRMINGKIYLDNIHTKYCYLVERGNLIDKEDNSPKNIIMIDNKDIKDIKENIGLGINDFKENIENHITVGIKNVKQNIEEEIKNVEEDIENHITVKIKEFDEGFEKIYENNEI